MGLRFLVGREAGSDTLYKSVVMFDSITGICFGRAIEGRQDLDALEVAEHFLDWARESQNIDDLRRLPVSEVVALQEQYDRIVAREIAEMRW